MRQSLLQNASSFLLQNATFLLQNATVITKCDDFTTKSDSCYKMRRLLRIATLQSNNFHVIPDALSSCHVSVEPSDRKL